MARSVNVILELPLVIGSLSHQGFSNPFPPSSHGVWRIPRLGGAISEFSHTRRRQWARSLMSLGPVQGRRRSLPEGMLSHTCPTSAVTLCTCEDFSEDAVVRSPPPPTLRLCLFFSRCSCSLLLWCRVQEKKAIQVLEGHFSIGVISNTGNVSISLNPYPQLDVGFVGVTLQWASDALSNSSIIATSNTFTSQLVTDRHVPARVWTDCLQALTHIISQFLFGFLWDSR